MQQTSAAKKKEVQSTSSQNATTKASATMIDAEILGGVVTNIEKLLTAKQRKKLQKSLRAREDASATALTVQRHSALPMQNRAYASSSQMHIGSLDRKKASWSQGFGTRSASAHR